LKRIRSILLLSFIFVVPAFGQVPKLFQSFSGWSSSLPRTNTINDILVRHDSIWFGTERGLSLTVNGGISWTHFSSTGTFDNKGISAIAVRNDLIWVATGYSTKLNDEYVQTGGGLHYSTDRGISWTFVPQPVDNNNDTLELYGRNKIRAMPVTVPQQNITFDIALTKNAVWTTSWAGMLRKYSFLDSSWRRVVLPPDNLDYIDTMMALDYAFDLSPSSGRLGLKANNNHLLFSVYAADDSTIWAGSAGGINKSTDGGMSWRKFSHQNQVHSISGNFVVALKEQQWRNRKIMWAATVNASEDEIKGVSFTQDGGSTWNNTLLGEWVHNIDSKDSIVYVAADAGIFRSSDYGESWIQNGSIYDPTNLQRFTSTECYGVTAQGDTVWFGGPEGIAYTIDSPSVPFGSTWKIFRTAEPLGNENRTYAFPNPFSPDDEPVRIHYSLGTIRSGINNVSIRLFNFAMQPVRTLIQQASRLNGQEYDEIWDGKNDARSVVANGVYFYRIETNNQDVIWGKILVLR